MDCIENYGIVTVLSRSRSPDCEWGGVWDCKECWSSRIIEMKGVEKMYRKNAEGAPDPTATDAIREADKPPKQMSLFIKIIKSLAGILDYEIVDRITIKDNNTGKIYKGDLKC